MLRIKTTRENIASVTGIINSEYRLDELVTVSAEDDPADIFVSGIIEVNPGWKNQQPPVLFSAATFSRENLLGIIYARLSNYEKAYPLLNDAPGVLQQVDLMNRLQNGIEINSIPEAVDYISLHNKAVVLHYSDTTGNDTGNIKLAYEAAIDAAAEYYEAEAFTIKHYALFLIDAGHLGEAASLLIKYLQEPHMPHVAIELKATLCVIWLKQLAVPYDEHKLAILKNYMWECLEFYEKESRPIDAAMILSDAAYIANISNSHSEALGYINRAIDVFQKEDLQELLGDALMKKGNILRRWAQHNNPQFFQQAVKAYQQALNIYTREATPSLFADIHHQLGILYSEIPDEIRKKSVWAAVSVSSFNEALAFYNKVDFPYEFAVICNSQGNAFTRYPDALHSDNFDKALAWYKEALDVQTADQYPVERSLTLLNYVDASWFAGNKSDFDEERFNDMVNKINEIGAISKDENIIQAAKEHLKKLLALQQAESTEKTA